MHLWILLFAASGSLLVEAACAAAVSSVAPAKADAEPAQGCTLTFESSAGGKIMTDTRHARLVALYVPESTPPTPFLPAGPFRATFTTDLSLRLRDEVTFSLIGAGAAKLSVNGTALIDGDLSDAAPLAAKPVSLKKGKNRIVLEYASPENGDAFVRLYWAASDFLPEPIPPQVLSHDASAQQLREGRLVREGRLLFATLHCAKCHGGEVHPPQPSRMPELDADAPSLADAGARLNEEWIARWITDPRSMRHNATMPRVVRDSTAARHIAAYLATVGNARAGEPAEPGPEALEEGGRIFAHLRCIACHTLPEHSDEQSVQGRTPLHYVNAKYRPAALVEFLKEPERRYAWTRMPNFRLSDREAESLAAFLMSREQQAIDDSGDPGGDAVKGKELVASSGCLNCHALADDVKSTLKAPTMAGISRQGWTRGCLAADESARGQAPDFGLTSDQRQALLVFTATDSSSLQRQTPAEFAERQIAALNCAACHARDDQEDLWARFQEETAELASNEVTQEEQGSDGERLSPDQSIPMLTWAGEKLRPEWMEKRIAGRLGFELRPWLRARMPGFPARSAHLARGMAMQHGFSPAAEPHGEADDQMAQNGMKLVGSAGGFQCIACHGVGDMKPTSVFEAPGINFKHSRQRLRKHYYDRWVIAPMRIHKETKMPAFADQEGRTSILDIYDGDARKQYDAIWHYLLAGEKIRAPEN